MLGGRTSSISFCPRNPSWHVIPSLCLLLCFLTTLFKASLAEEDFSCTKKSLFPKVNPPREVGVILPRKDILVQVGGPPVSVLCRFNDKYINATDVYFQGQDDQKVPHTIINSTTIQAEILSQKVTIYKLECYLRKKGSHKKLCAQFVKAGPLPEDFQDLKCLSRNFEDLNCTWTRPTNPIGTNYNVTFKVPGFLNYTPCPTNTKNYCYWDTRNRLSQLRFDEFTLYITGSNMFGNRTYAHHINIPEVVLPNKVDVSLSLVEETKVRVDWRIPFHLKAFFGGLLHVVEYRVAGEESWIIAAKIQSIPKMTTLDNPVDFSIEKSLNLSYVEFEFRVRIHTLVGEIREEMWSKYDVVSIKTKPLPPSIAPKVDTSSFEVVEELKYRDVYVNFENLNPLYYGGEDFSYKTLVFPSGLSQPIEMKPIESTKAYFKFPSMNFTEYKFVIIPVNRMGQGEAHSEVIIPNSDCMPKKTGLFTAINRKSVISLYWVPSKMSNIQCSGSSHEIDSYTIYWCKKTYDDRCKEKLTWMTIKSSNLSKKIFGRMAVNNTIFFEKNLTGLPRNQLHTFGVAANSGNYSSGIKWSSCIVDESDSPAPPSLVFGYPKNYSVVLTWSLKCSSLSTVPIGFKVSYCEADIPDFGHCLSDEYFVEENSPKANQTIISQHLKPDISYIFSVSVLSSIGEGRQSRPVKVKIPVAKPVGPPLNLAVKTNTLTNTSAVVQWKPPHKEVANGPIVQFKIVLLKYLEPNHSAHIEMRSWFVRAPPKHRSGLNQPNKVLVPSFESSLGQLQPFQRYLVRVMACTNAGCSEEQHGAKMEFRTKEGVPNAVKIDLDVSNWRLEWSLDKCNSRLCSFEVLLPLNGTHQSVNVSGTEVLHLTQYDINCTNNAMNFSIRAVGSDEHETPLFSKWSTVMKLPSECPPEMLSVWLILGLCISVALLAILFYVLTKFGVINATNSFKDYFTAIRMPIGLESEKYIPEHRPARRTSEPLNLNPPSLSFKDAITQDRPYSNFTPQEDEERTWPKLSRGSLSSEEEKLIQSLEGERHGRNLSGSSDHSSGQDSAVPSESPSVNEGEVDALTSKMNVRYRPPTINSPYVQHGMFPITGYVAARSVPSLPHFCNNPSGFLDKTNQNYVSLQLVNNPTAAQMGKGEVSQNRRASTGYISMLDCESGKTSPCLKNQGEEISAMPIYSRHSFDPTISERNPPQLSWLSSGYVALADPSPEHEMPSVPLSGTTGYVSVSDPLGHGKYLPKSNSLLVTEEDAPPAAYCRVGSRDEDSNGRPFESTLPHSEGGPTKSPYVTCGQAFLLSQQRPESEPAQQTQNPFEGRQATPYVQLADTSNWGQPVSSLNGSENAPHGKSKASPKDGFAPSLSKQSSGYVSQEAIPVVISPKRLLAQSRIPHSIVLSQNHQASMV